MAEDFALSNLLDSLEIRVRNELSSKPDVLDDWSGDIDVSQLSIVKREWVQIPDVVAVVADLKNSTHMGTGKHAASTASIYEAATGGVVSALNALGADFIQIQGDGAFGLFWRSDRVSRAVCAAITIQTFGGMLTDRLEAKWPDAPTTGLKVGVARSRILVKRIGTPRNPAQQEPVWAGKAVNYAAKAAQGADRHQLVVTGSVWDAVEGNDYLTVSCGCGGDGSSSPSPLWDDTEIQKLPAEDPDRQGRVLTASWCETHGEDYCAAVLAGKTIRPEVKSQREAVLLSQRHGVLRQTARQGREARRARLRGLSR